MIPHPVLKLLLLAIDVYWLILLIEVIISWIPAIPRYHPFVRLVHSLSEPVLRPLRRLVPPEKLGYLDVSPIIAFLLLSFLRRILMSMPVVR